MREGSSHQGMKFRVTPRHVVREQALCLGSGGGMRDGASHQGMRHEVQGHTMACRARTAMVFRDGWRHEGWVMAHRHEVKGGRPEHTKTRIPVTRKASKKEPNDSKQMMKRF